VAKGIPVEFAHEEQHRLSLYMTPSGLPKENAKTIKKSEA
jgi:hypothetical protein